MVAQPLVEPQIETGRNLIAFLDTHDMRPEAAFWLFSSDFDEWRLMLAFKEVDDLGPRRTYEMFQELQTGVSLNDVSVISPRSELVRKLRRAVRTGKHVASIRLTGNVIDGTYIEDALIYRL
jgi:hypothetical protein